jgi:ankyrin repeat protein
LEVVRLLPKLGADINIRDANKNTALHLAAAPGIVDIIKLLLDNGMSLNLTNTNKSTPLHIFFILANSKQHKFWLK